jgi:hypothetical protein
LFIPGIKKKVNKIRYENTFYVTDHKYIEFSAYQSYSLIRRISSTMKHKLGALLASLAIFGGMTLQAQTVLDTQFNTAMTGFVSSISGALPDNALVGTSWSDAYIGQLIGVPPHFGIGVSVGATRFSVVQLSDAMSLLGKSLPSEISGIPLPSYAVEARVGGFLLPFDVGVRFGALPTITMSGLSLNYLNLGFDVRYALMEEGIVKPDIVVGAGFYYSKFGIGYTFNPASLAGLDGSYTSDQTLAISAESKVIELKAQVSKSFVIVTPYAGVGGSVAFNEGNYSLTKETTGSTANTVYGVRVYGGTSLNLAVFKVDVSAMYNFISQNYGFNLGMRVQL